MFYSPAEGCVIESGNRQKSSVAKSHASEFRETFGEAHSLATRIALRGLTGHEAGLKAAVRYALDFQTTSDYPFLMKYAFARREEDGAAIAPILAGVHLLQTSTMITDDIFDVSRLRYGRSVLHRKHGLSHAIIVAALFQSRGLEEIGRALENGNFSNPTRVLALLNRIIADCYTGQYLDLATSGDSTVSVNLYYRIIRLCAGNFFANLAACGALLANKSRRETAALARFGYNYGMGLFLTDDIIDITDSTRQTGKSLAPDLKGRRMRLPMILALTASRPGNAARLRSFLRSSGTSDASTLAAAQLIRNSGALEMCRDTAQKYLRRAKRALDRTTNRLTRARLTWLCDSLFTAQEL
jgi:geranylgeranyl pyrophosphate synthase